MKTRDNTRTQPTEPPTSNETVSENVPEANPSLVEYSYANLPQDPTTTLGLLVWVAAIELHSSARAPKYTEALTMESIDNT